MDTFNKKSLCVALGAAGLLGAAGVAQAVNVASDGLGNVLIYPYYTVSKDVNGNEFITLMSVVNTTASTKAVKVRVREGRNSVEVLDFNVFLSPFDVWTALISSTPHVSGSDLYGGQITTGDNSCTIPTLKGRNEAFRTTTLDSGDNSVTRTKEGYIEVFEMATYTSASVVGVNSKHDSSGVPANCSKVTDTVALAEQQPPSGGLFGNVSIYSPAGGGMWSEAAVALANFSTTAGYFDTGSTLPTYGNANPTVSNVLFGSKLYQTTWGATPAGGAGFNAVTAVLMANAVTNEYALEIGSKAQTTWIVTQPTKFNYVNSASAIAPYTSKYVSKTGACENFYGIVFNREEGSPQVITSVDFSPQPAPGSGPQLCWEAQSIGFGQDATSTGGTKSSNVFGSANHNSISTPYVTGWSTLGWNSVTAPNEHSLIGTAGATTVVDLTGVAAPLAGQQATYFGLPVVGFAAFSNQNDAIVVGGKTYLSTFGNTSIHHPTKKVQ